MKKIAFNAPWGAPLLVMTVACTLVFLLIPIPGIIIAWGRKIPGLSYLPPWIGWMLVIVPVLTILASLFLMVRGYVLTEDSLIVKRLGWETRFALAGLISAVFTPEAVRGSIRVFGNGGFFSFTGIFRNKELGVYRAYATDTKRTVVVRFSHRTIVVTPDDPEKFVGEINSRPTLA